MGILRTYCRRQVLETHEAGGMARMLSARRQCWPLQKMENSGNEAKEYLKTKDFTFFNAVNCARFAHQLTAIVHCYAAIITIICFLAVGQ